MQQISKDVWGVSHQWARFLFDELLRNGVCKVICSTGGRSTALAAALADFEDIELLVHPDE